MDTLGVVESKSIAAGAELADGMLKSAEVSLVRASPICPGRFLIFVSGDRAGVESAVAFARASGRPLTGSFVISNISPRVPEALKKHRPAGQGEALGLVESRDVASGIMAADAALKRSSVSLLRLTAGQGIQGKSFFVISGGVAAVREAVQAAEAALGSRLVEAVVIARPEAAVAQALTGVVEK